MIFNEHVKIREEKFGAVIFETLKEKIFVTNQAGKDILNLLQEGHPIEKIIDILADDYEVSAEQIKNDVVGFADQLRTNKILA